ncbi:RDD family protein [Marinicella sediminis]|uniref:RDD family protein n=1 Tax=Marinicella sediminis TaxID=1792834 RepID=A0ABV7J4M2_9GAMM|nr:RDD family protein [Marinicella sediminis]
MSNHRHSQLWKHLAALVYDIFPILAIWLITSLIFVMFRGGEEIKPETLWFQIILLAEVYFYFAYSWKTGGQTLGMRAWKLGIEHHRELSWPQVSLRFMAGVISTLLLGMGLWHRIWQKDQKTWMDLACQQRVVDLSVNQ